MMRKVKSFLLYNQKIRFLKVILTNILGLCYPIVIRIYRIPKIHTIEETILKIRSEKLSIARFGDGEVIFLVNKLALKFKEYDERLALLMRKMLKNGEKNLLIGLPDGYRSVNQFDKKIAKYTRSQVAFHYPRFFKFLDVKTEYWNANITRLYFGYKDQTLSGYYFELIRSIWNNRNVLLVEGEKSRLGVGNDLFDNAKSVERILGPMHHAFRKFDNLFHEVLTHSTSKLVLVAMGPTAKVLAYQLTEKGFQVIDVGNLDIEYTWYKSGSKERFKVRGKYTSEVAGGRDVEDVIDPIYASQIVASYY
ncbi:MAG: GT-D fold domain-containing glycosyltransferase [Cyclobacteriaceae bacterium]|nr:GT-D fold domain-containing glycosyltransferase [Cyclobacteriaceae bacterium]